LIEGCGGRESGPGGAAVKRVLDARDAARIGRRALNGKLVLQIERPLGGIHGQRGHERVHDEGRGRNGKGIAGGIGDHEADVRVLAVFRSGDGDGVVDKFHDETVHGLVESHPRPGKVVFTVVQARYGSAVKKQEAVRRRSAPDKLFVVVHSRSGDGPDETGDARHGKSRKVLERDSRLHFGPVGRKLRIERQQNPVHAFSRFDRGRLERRSARDCPGNARDRYRRIDGQGDRGILDEGYRHAVFERAVVGKRAVELDRRRARTGGRLAACRYGHLFRGSQGIVRKFRTGIPRDTQIGDIKRKVFPGFPVVHVDGGYLEGNQTVRKIRRDGYF